MMLIEQLGLPKEVSDLISAAIDYGYSSDEVIHREKLTKLIEKYKEDHQMTMTVDEFVKETRRDWKREGPINQYCMGCTAFSVIRNALDIIERQREENKICNAQIVFLKSSLISWRKREWPGTDQDSVITRDLQQIAREELAKEV